MDTEPTVERQLLRHAERQTKALESLRAMALVWMALLGLAVAIWLIALMSDSGLIA